MMHLILSLLLLQAVQSPNSPAQRQAEHARHHDAIVPQEMQWEPVYLPLRKPMVMHEGWILHCDAHWINFCMIERPKNPKPIEIYGTMSGTNKYSKMWTCQAPYVIQAHGSVDGNNMDASQITCERFNPSSPKPPTP